MQVGCGLTTKEIRGRPYLYFWHYEERGGRRVQLFQYIGSPGPPRPAAGSRPRSGHTTSGSPSSSGTAASPCSRSSRLPEAQSPNGPGGIDAGMRLRVLLFATLREIVGEGEIAWSAGSGTTVDAFLTSFLRAYPRLAPHRKTMLVAVNRAFAEPTVVLQDGDEVALLPPVSGGAR